MIKRTIYTPPDETHGRYYLQLHHTRKGRVVECFYETLTLEERFCGKWTLVKVVDVTEAYKESLKEFNARMYGELLVGLIH